LDPSDIDNTTQTGVPSSVSTPSDTGVADTSTGDASAAPTGHAVPEPADETPTAPMPEPVEPVMPAEGSVPSEEPEASEEPPAAPAGTF